MKRFLVILLAIMTLVFPAAGWAQRSAASLQNVPEIQEADTLPLFFVERVMAVDLGWDSVYRDPEIDTYLVLPYSAEQVRAVILTDGVRLVYGRIEQLGDNFLYVVFNTDIIRLFLTRGVYLVIIAGNE